MRTISKKIILTGSFCVGKTSLISQFVYSKFPNIYQTTLGVKIDRKTIELNDFNLDLIIWDIGGEQTQTRIPLTFYTGAAGVIYVFDVSRPSSFFNIENDMNLIKQQLPNVPIIIVGNKVDLIDEKTLDEIINILPIQSNFFTSAKNNHNVEEVFNQLAKAIAIHVN